MSQKFQDLKIDLEDDLEEKLQWLMPDMAQYRILRKSVDARRKKTPQFVYTVECFKSGENPDPFVPPLEKLAKSYSGPPVGIIGAGPAGLFAAIRLVERGIPCKIFERGSQAEKRILGINRFWRYGELDPSNNVCFGEGGAGLYSDGKLITRIKSPYIPYVMDRLVQFGAPDEIRYLANPHVGSDKIRRLIPKMRQFIQSQGGEFIFDSEVTELLTSNSQKIKGLRLKDGRNFEFEQIILACGHSADELFQHLKDIDVFMESKPFAIGLRIEHSQELINKIQYGDFWDHPKLSSANYKLTYNDKETQRGVFSFCMCPGGYVLSSGSHVGQVVCNGMSNFNRNSPYANSAVVVSVNAEEKFSGEGLFAGLQLRNQLEKSGYQAVVNAGGNKQLPAQKLKDFLDETSGPVSKGSSPSGAMSVRLDQVLPQPIKEVLITALHNFDRKMKGFIHPEAQLYGMETRTSCPIRITRNKETLESISHKGLYPTGEGAGYAGGITSAACDGIKVAEQIFETQSS